MLSSDILLFFEFLMFKLKKPFIKLYVLYKMI